MATIDWASMPDHELGLLADYGRTTEIVVAARCEQARRQVYSKAELDFVYETPHNYLEVEYACPNCAEHHIDLLVWREDDTGVECRKCGHYYKL